MLCWRARGLESGLEMSGISSMNGIIAMKKKENDGAKPTEVGHAKSQAALGPIGNQSWNHDTYVRDWSQISK